MPKRLSTFHASASVISLSAIAAQAFSMRGHTPHCSLYSGKLQRKMLRISMNSQYDTVPYGVLCTVLCGRNVGKLCAVLFRNAWHPRNWSDTYSTINPFGPSAGHVFIHSHGTTASFAIRTSVLCCSSLSEITSTNDNTQ